MNQEKSLIRIAELLSRFKIETAIRNANAQLDINIIAEDVLIPVLNIVFDCNLVNAKYSENDAQFPAIDLFDKNKKIAFQITSTSKLAKVQKTLEGIRKNKFYQQFDVFYIYILTERQNSYDQIKIDGYTGKEFVFSKQHIIDEKDLYKKIASITFDNIQKVQDILEIQFSDNVLNEKQTQEDLVKIVQKLKSSKTELFLITELEGALDVRQQWLEKRIFFELKLPIVSDINQQFSIQSNLAEIDKKIEECNIRISHSLMQIQS